MTDRKEVPPFPPRRKRGKGDLMDEKQYKAKIGAQHEETWHIPGGIFANH